MAVCRLLLLIGLLVRPLSAGPLHHSALGRVDPEREIDMAYGLLEAAPRQTSSPTDAVGDGGGDGALEPTYHYEVHRVQHKNLATAEEKLKAVIRQAAALAAATGPNPGPARQQVQSRASDTAPDELDTDAELVRPPENSLAAEDRPVAQPQGPFVREMANPSSIADIYFLAVVAGCSVAGVAGLLFAGVCWYRLHKKVKAASDVDYPAYGVTGPVSGSREPRAVGPAGGDRKLAQSAQMYHYQHQKQQMIASERLSAELGQQSAEQGVAGSDVESEEENEEGDYTVFECPGLATAGEMEVRNPMFNNGSNNDQQTPVAGASDSLPSPPTRK